MKKLISIAIGALALASSYASAALLTTTMHVDNNYKVYISTSDSVQGTLFDSGDSWPTGFQNQVQLNPGQDYYLHIYAGDEGGLASLLGQFSLTFKDHVFANGTQSLLSNTTNWFGNTTGFNGKYGSVSDQGQNGVSPWGYQSDINGSARWIWVGDANNVDAVYLTTKISAVANVPEPTSIALLGLGFLGMGGVLRRKAKA
jgi:hypothetical protein